MCVLGVTESYQDGTQDWNLVLKAIDLFKRRDLLGGEAVGSECEDTPRQRNP